MSTSIPAPRRDLLIALESILGNECFNASIRNYGPHGIREADGRSFRYPITLRSSDGSTVKVRDPAIPGDTADEALRSGYYAFGSNQLDVMTALDRMLVYLEKHHGLRVDVPDKGDGSATAKGTDA